MQLAVHAAVNVALQRPHGPGLQDVVADVDSSFIVRCTTSAFVVAISYIYIAQNSIIAAGVLSRG
jgi:hypothetical protein